MAGEVDDGDRSEVVAEDRVVDEGNFFAVARKTGIADPARSFVENFAGGIFEAVEVALGYEANDGKIFAVRSPIGILDGIEDGARGAAANGETGECACADVTWTDLLNVL